MAPIVSRKRKRSACESMTRDIRNISRGQCKACGDCEGFLTVSGQVRCDYCGCPPAHHENLVKKARKDSSEDKSDISEVSSLEILELEDTEDDEGNSTETTETDDSCVSSVSTSTKKSGYKRKLVGIFATCYRRNEITKTV